jgi:hypothetical protein
MTKTNRPAGVHAVPAPRFLILANAPDFCATRGVGAEIGLLVFGMTQALWSSVGDAINAAIKGLQRDRMLT